MGLLILKYSTLLKCHRVLSERDLQPRYEPALELHSRAASNVGVMYHSSGPNTRSNSGGGRILKKSERDSMKGNRLVTRKKLLVSNVLIKTADNFS